MKELKIGIYLITNKLNGKKYVGQSINVNKRWKEHISIAINPKSKKYAIHNAIAKYGSDNFSWEILYYCSSLNESNALETKLIKQHNCLHPFGYNLNEGGNSHVPCDAVKEKIKEKLKIVSSLVGKKGKDHPSFGRKISQEQKEEQSKILSGENGPNKKINSKIAVAIYQEYLNGESVKTLKTKYNLGKTTILNILNKKSWKEASKDLPTVDLKINQCGENYINSKLTEEEVVEIYNKYKTKNHTQSDLAKECNISITAVFNIVNKKSWKHLKL